jgi:hypothetical protein
LWVDVDVALPYSAGELLARVRERGTVELEYGERDVRIVGRVAPALAGELEAIAEAWRLTNEDAADDEPRGASAAPTGRPTKAARRAADADDAAEAASEAVGRGTERFTTDGELVIDPAGDAQQGTANGTETQTGTEAAATR